MEQDEPRAVRVRIHGRVQGVWYRGWTVERATGLGLRGWVRNRADGTVEAVFAGSGDAVERMLVDCRAGPPAARVVHIAVEPAEDPGPGGFAQRPTA
ncbi:acylphosphatase [Azospirillum halopraeferens]|uniref:acylphosphatase n=1 Tax=Azospirillum halopraeferens TaxID=34010 RepID=UPI00040E7D1A|nr:acylphosphatase [Azospirillum halopraeferens]